MNTFDLRAALLAKHAQHPIINPRIHEVEHGSNAWLTNSKLLPSRVCARRSVISFLAAIYLFFDTIRGISHAISSLKICTPE